MENYRNINGRNQSILHSPRWKGSFGVLPVQEGGTVPSHSGIEFHTKYGISRISHPEVAGYRSSRAAILRWPGYISGVFVTSVQRVIRMHQRWMEFVDEVAKHANDTYAIERAGLLSIEKSDDEEWEYSDVEWTKRNEFIFIRIY